MNLLRDSVYEVLAWTSVLLGSLSAISAIVRVANVGLEGLWNDIVQTYRTALSPLYEFIQLFAPFEIQLLWIDLTALYSVLLVMSIRAQVLPLLQDPIALQWQRERDGPGVYDLYLTEEPEEQKGWINPVRLDDGSWRVTVLGLSSIQSTYARAVLSSILLWPAISLKPLRLLDRRFLPLLKRTDAKPVGDVWLRFSGEDGPFNVHKYHLALTKTYRRLSIQLVSVPVAVVLFFVIETYVPI